MSEELFRCGGENLRFPYFSSRQTFATWRMSRQGVERLVSLPFPRAGCQISRSARLLSHAHALNRNLLSARQRFARSSRPARAALSAWLTLESPQESSQFSL